MDISSLSTANTLCVLLSAGFEDRRRSVCLSCYVDFLSFEEFLCSTHEEADTRMAMHVAFCFRNSFERVNGFERLTICANDTDVVVILVDQFPRLLNMFLGRMLCLKSL